MLALTCSKYHLFACRVTDAKIRNRYSYLMKSLFDRLPEHLSTLSEAMTPPNKDSFRRTFVYLKEGYVI